MSIRKKILLYFSLIIPMITAIAFMAIYWLAAESREETFQMLQKDKIVTTLEILTDIKESDEEIIKSLDQITINEMFNEKLLLFNEKKKLIYSNIVDIPVPVSKDLLAKLNPKTKWIETREEFYDVVGTSIRRNGKTYYGISKAHDDFGYSQLRSLQYILISTFLAITLIIVLAAFYISKKISTPLTEVTEKISNYDFNSPFVPISFEESKDEISILARVFNELMSRMNDAFAFQKHAVHHISHELKTPIAILVSNFERMEKETDPEKLKTLIHDQKEDTKSLSEIINSLLEIAKMETGNLKFNDTFRIDELIFDVSDRLKNIHPQFVFSVDYDEPVEEDKLMVRGNIRLMQAALSNLMENCIHYSTDDHATIRIRSHGQLEITFENTGKTLNKQESSYLFKQFFRGENSKGKRGFGLGLVFVGKICEMHQAEISYSSGTKNLNCFKITFS